MLCFYRRPLWSVDKSKLLDVLFITKGLFSVKLSISSQWIRLFSVNFYISSQWIRLFSVHFYISSEFLGLFVQLNWIQLMVSALIHPGARPRELNFCWAHLRLLIIKQLLEHCLVTKLNKHFNIHANYSISYGPGIFQFSLTFRSQTSC